MSDQATWIADGTAEAEPETTETPAAEAVEVVEPVVEEVVATEVAPVVEAVVEEVAQTFIEGKLGEEAFQLPDNVLLPMKRGEETEFVSIQDVMKDGLRERDYRAKTMAHADTVRAFETSQANHAAQQAKLDAKAKYLTDQEAEINAALSNPESAAQYQQHLNMLQTNPMYKQTWDGRLANREIEAERDALVGQEEQRVVDRGTTAAFEWIESLATEFDGVDPGRVASTYGQRLKDGTASLDISDVRSIYQAEASYLQGANAPLREQLATLEAKINGLKASQVSEEHNSQTQHAVTRAKTVPVATGAGAPAKGHVPLGKFGPSELAERNSAWSKAG